VTLTIGKVATIANVSTDTLRYYEREGLVEPAAKGVNGYRVYDDNAVRRIRIRFIKEAQHCGFTLTEIRTLLDLRTRDATCCNDVRRVALEKKLQLEAKIKAMKAMSKTLDHLIADCGEKSRSLKDCPILAALDRGKQVKK
jgi:MerR family Zn(II)-responsive transcriptional regulator of zntA